ncbi:hypothetical protein B6U80_02270 [Candidatus Pacearchaeota archaeon ex4484_26]|nr:MAG: hypothetical protein B6U80_02270 [Candidatus Pacearchaeota archaeon ex4484_26]
MLKYQKMGTNIDFKTVYKVDEERLLRLRRKTFLAEKDKQNFFSGKAYKLLYFLEVRTDNFPQIPIFKVQSEWPKTLLSLSSVIKGPFTDVPSSSKLEEILKETIKDIDLSYKTNFNEKIKEDELNHIIKDVNYIRRVIPIDKVPTHFDKIRFIEYGLGYNRLGSIEDIKNGKEIKKIGEKALKKLSGHPKAILDGCLVRLFYDPNVSKNVNIYGPVLYANILGFSENNPEQIIRKLGLDKMEEEISWLLGLGQAFWKKNIREGLAYNLSITKDINLGSLAELENIILFKSYSSNYD